MKSLVFLLLIGITGLGNCSRERRGIENIPNGIFETSVDIASNDNVSIDCEAYNTTIWVSREFLDTLNVNEIEQLAFLDEDGNILEGCSEESEEDYHFVLGEFAACAASTETTPSYIIVNYTLCVVPYFPPEVAITRDTSVTFQFSCIFDPDILVSDVVIDSTIRKLRLEDAQEEGEFDVDMQRFESDNFIVPETDETVLVDDLVFIGLTLDTGGDSGLILQMQTCWGTPTDDPEDVVRFYFVEDGCAAVDPWRANSNEIYMNYMSNKAQFSFTSYFWSNLMVAGQNIFIHCEVEICPSNIPGGSQCLVPPTCPIAGPGLNGRRRRRSVDDSNDVKIFSIGPVSVTAPSCDQDLLGCSHGCATLSNARTVCVCPSGYYLADNQKTCKVEWENLMDIEGQSTMDIDMNSLYYLAASVLVIITVAVLAIRDCFPRCRGDSVPI